MKLLSFVLLSLITVALILSAVVCGSYEPFSNDDTKENVDETQTRHIEEIRKVLSDTITHLKKDDILPSGTHCGCAQKPMVDPISGLAKEATDCRPPGWMRMMEYEVKQNKDCPLQK